MTAQAHSSTVGAGGVAIVGAALHWLTASVAV